MIGASRGGLILDTSKLAIVYPRQSSGMQVKENVYSLENQLKLIDQAHADGFAPDRVLLIDEDLGKSAQTIEKRVGMVRALELVDKGLVGALYAEDQTRLSRDKDTVDHMSIAKQCRMAGVPLFYGGAWRDLSDRGTRIAYKVEAVIGSEMWSLHQDKMQLAQQAKARRGQLAGSRPSRGYRIRKDLPKKDPKRDTLVIEPEEAAIIRELAARLEEVGSLRKLERAIAGARWPDGKRITYGHLQKIMKGATYRGHVVWGDVVVEGAHEAIITPEQGARIDALLAHNKATLRRPAREDGAQLVGLVWCPACGRKLTTAPGAHSMGYLCRYKATPVADPIRHFEIKAANVDAIALGHLWRRLDGGLVADVLAHLGKVERRRAEVVDLQEGAMRALRRKVEGLAMTLANPDLPEAARRVLVEQLDLAARELEAASAPPPAAATIEADLTFYREMAADPDHLASLAHGWADEPLAWRRRWLARLIERVDLVCSVRGVVDVVTRFRDGSTMSERIVTRVRTDADQLARMRQLWDDPERPAFGWLRWMAAKMAAEGFPRSHALGPDGGPRGVGSAAGDRGRSG
jgi:DNA invertase Pin-like site-specific DNA recombinase